MPRHGSPDLLQPVTGIVGLFKGLYAFGKALHTIGKIFNALTTVLLPFIIIIKVLGSFLKLLEFLTRPWNIFTIWKTVGLGEPSNITVKAQKRDIKQRNGQAKPLVPNELIEKIEKRHHTRTIPNYLCATTTATTSRRQTSRPTTTGTSVTRTTTTRIRQTKETEIWYVITNTICFGKKLF